MTVDLHTHITPADIPQNGSRGRLWPRMERNDPENATVVIDGKPFRRINSCCWDAKRRLADMGNHGVRAQVLSPMPELLSFWLDTVDTAYLASHINEHIAAMVATAPDRFGGLGMVAAQDMPTAIAQLADVERLNLSGIEIGTHINGLPLGDPAIWPLYEAAEARGLAIFVHPLHPCGLDRIGGVAEVGLVASFPIEIAMAAISLVSGGIFQKFPGLRILLSHGGGALPSLFGRLDKGRDVSAPIRAALVEDFRSSSKRFWFDSNVYDPAVLRFLVEQVGADRVVVGSDYPFAIQQERAGHFVDEALPGLLGQCTHNAAAFLHGDNSSRWRLG